MDVENGDAVIEILKNLAHNEGYCAIIATHNLEIAKVSAEVYRMSDGVISC